MVLPGLVLLVILGCSDVTGHSDPDLECEDCNENGSWWPLFQPSQIISSELPEHEQYRSGEASPPLTYANSGSQSHECGDGPPRVVELSSHELAGIDSPVKTYNGDRGDHRVEWDHYGDITTVATVAYNSLEDRSSPQRGHVSQEARVSGEDRSDNGESVSSEGNRRKNVPVQDASASVRSQEVNSFFDNGSFFDERLAPPKDNFPEDFEVSNEYPYSGEHHHYGNSVEDELNTHANIERSKKPIATSYASISSVFESRPIPRSRDLLHPDLSYNDISHYIKSEMNNPRFYGVNRTKQYLVHEPQSHEVPGVLHINHVVPSASPMVITRNNKPPPGFSPLGPRPSAYVPLDHPVYRYVKVHGGMGRHYRRPPQNYSTLRWEDIHPQLRSKFPFKYLRPRVHVQRHETVVHHVVPTKDPFSDSFWKESQKIEDLKPPPLGQTLYYFKKKPSTLEMTNIARRRQSPGFMYIIRRNKKLK